MAGKANKTVMVRGVKWVSSPHVGVKGHRSTTSTWNAPTYREVPTPNLEGWLCTLQSSQAEMTEHEGMLFKRKRGVVYETP